MFSPSDHILELCQSSPTVTQQVAEDPSKPVQHVVEHLRKSLKVPKTRHSREESAGDEREALERAAKCGKFDTRPSDLFLKVFSDILSTLETDPLGGVVSPSLLGSTGVIPLSIVSVIPDIMRHYAELIVKAKHEVFLATNYWEDSTSSRIIADSLRELSNRTPSGKKIIVKLMYDRGTPKQTFKNHAEVKPEEWEKVGLPHHDELKNLSLQVVNYHRPILGTFHAKYLVVDREVACLNSNNIQDRPNVEMCIHIEGPIVESFYDMALISWANALEPPLPLLANPPDYSTREYKFGRDNERLQYIDTDYMAAASRSLLRKQLEQEKKDSEKREKEPKRKRVARHIKNVGRMAANIHTGGGRELGKDKDIAAHPQMQVPHIVEIVENAYEKERGLLNHSQSSETHEKSDRKPSSSSQITPTSSGSRDDETDFTPPTSVSENSRQDTLDETNPAEEQGDVPQSPSPTDSTSSGESDDDGEQSAPVGDTKEPGKLGATEPKEEKEKHLSRVELLAAYLNAENFDAQGTARDDPSLDHFRPHIMHKPHNPVPIAMCNRYPRGTPGHEKVDTVPQNVAWLSAMGNAQKNIFIQTPTFNASPAVPAILDACRRGVQVTLYLDLGFNDLGEMIPFQGGTNEQVVGSMYSTLNQEGQGAENNLHVYWYTAKDQSEPMSATEKKRNCHVKFMSVDDQIAILGNGNQDTQSWFHSQEINILVDSPELVAEWIAGLNANQNTFQHGRVDKVDGVWRDESGRVIQSSGPEKAGVVTRVQGFSGAIRRVRGTGGF